MLRVTGNDGPDQWVRIIDEPPGILSMPGDGRSDIL
jgi:hypothetical protein